MPFAEISAPVIRIGKQFRKAFKFVRQRLVVVRAIVRVWPGTAEQRRTRRGADRLRHVGALKDCRLGGKFVNVRSMNGARAFTENSVRAQFVRKKNNQVRLGRKFGWLRSNVRGQGNASRAERGSANKMTTREVRIHRNSKLRRPVRSAKCIHRGSRRGAADGLSYFLPPLAIKAFSRALRRSAALR